MGSLVHRSVPTNLKWFPNCSPAHTLFQDRFKDIQVGSKWFSTLYVLSPNFHTKRSSQVDQSWGLFDHQFFNATGEDHFLESRPMFLQLRFFFCPSPLLFGASAVLSLTRGQRESNHHRQSVSDTRMRDAN